MAFNADKLLVNLLLEQNIVHTLVSCAEVKKKEVSTELLGGIWASSV